VRRHAAAVATAQVETLRASTATLAAALRARIITLYAELWRVDRTSKLLDDSRTLLATAAQAAQARYESGEGIQEGLIRAQSAVRRVDLELIELALTRRQAEIGLGAATGRQDDPEFGATGELPEVAGPIDEPGLAAAAAASSPDVLESSARGRTAEAQLDDTTAAEVTALRRTQPDPRSLAERFDQLLHTLGDALAHFLIRLTPPQKIGDPLA
jgi:outer membrane protein TolC